jgi:predicted nucleic-acid-binding protein
MIGVDTNVLLRAIMLDDRRQAEQARKFLNSRTPASPAVINTVVLAEVAWSLRSSFGLPRAEIASILRDMMSSDAFYFIDRTAVARALASYESGYGQFPDRLIAEVNDAYGCGTTVTFDATAAKQPPFSRVP